MSVLMLTPRRLQVRYHLQESLGPLHGDGRLPVHHRLVETLPCQSVTGVDGVAILKITVGSVWVAADCADLSNIRRQVAIGTIPVMS